MLVRGADICDGDCRVSGGGSNVARRPRTQISSSVRQFLLPSVKQATRLLRGRRCCPGVSSSSRRRRCSQIVAKLTTRDRQRDECAEQDLGDPVSA